MEPLPLPRLYSFVITIFAHSIVRIAGSASGVLVGIYLANLHGHGFPVDAGLLGIWVLPRLQRS